MNITSSACLWSRCFFCQTYQLTAVRSVGWTGIPNCNIALKNAHQERMLRRQSFSREGTDFPLHGGENVEEAAPFAAGVTSPSWERKITEYSCSDGAFCRGAWSAVEWLGHGSGQRRLRSMSVGCSAALQTAVECWGRRRQWPGWRVVGAQAGYAVVGGGSGGEGTSRLGAMRSEERRVGKECRN